MLQKEVVNGLATTYSKGNYEHIVLFVPGGSTDSAPKRFEDWQIELEKNNIGSISFDFPGVGETPGQLKLSSLESRIHLTQLIVLWIKENLKPQKISIYGVSMGGYVALSTAHANRHINGTVIIQAPAAYAQEAHDKRFNQEFTNILRTENSFLNSYSFEWLQDLQQKVVLIVHTKDIVVPKEITDKYKEIGDSKYDFIYRELDSGHRIWDKKHKRIREETIKIIKGVI